MRIISRRRLRIPFSVRVVLFPLVSVFVILAVVIYGRRLISEPFPCLYQDRLWIDATTGKTFLQNNPKVSQRSENGRLRQQVISRPAVLWSTYGQRQAFIEFHHRLSPRLVITSPNEGIRQEFELDSTISDRRPEYIWARDGSYAPSIRLSWSPNGSYVLLEQWDGTLLYPLQTGGETKPAGFWHYSRFGIDGTVYRDFLIVPQTEQTPLGADLSWARDGKLLAVSANFYPGSFHVMPVGIPNNLYEPLVAVPFHEINGKLSLATSGFRRSTSRFVEEADSIGRPAWSPDGQWVAAVWATGHGSARIVRLSWMKVEDRTEQTIDDHLWDVREVTWLADGKSLAYVAQRDSRVSVEIADLKTGTHRVIRDHLENAARLSQNPATGKITFWWRDTDRRAGIASYLPDGQLLHETYLIQSLRPPGLLEVFRNPYEWVRIPEVYPSPDGSMVIISAWRWLGELISLQLVAADGSWSKEISVPAASTSRKSFIYVSNILWSPDSKRFLVAYRDVDNFPHEAVDIWKSDGTMVSTVIQNGITSALTWSACN